MKELKLPSSNRQRKWCLYFIIYFNGGIFSAYVALFLYSYYILVSFFSSFLSSVASGLVEVSDGLAIFNIL